MTVLHYYLPRLFRMLTLVGMIFCWSLQPALALSGWEVIEGDVTFDRQGDVFNVTSGSQNAIVQWQTFDVGQNQTVNFFLPDPTASILNRILGGPSSILGALNSNGTVLLSNPAGINIGAAATINTGSFIATTLNISNPDYLSGNWAFSGNDGSPAGILNEGTITTSTGGFVVLAGGAVANHGNIFAPDGTVNLSVGDKIRIDMTDSQAIEVTVDERLLGKVQGFSEAIGNTGDINAHRVELQAELATALYDRTINNAGLIRTTSATREGTQIRIYGYTDDQMALIRNGGTLDASGNTLVFDGGTISMMGDRTEVTGNIYARGGTGGEGGLVHVLGDEVALYGNASIDVSGDAGGGEILVGGDYQGQNPDIANAQKTWVTSGVTLFADALDSGNGGKVIVWADDSTQYYGGTSARGGMSGGDGGLVEISGKQRLNFMGNVDLSASGGTNGTLLLDPTDINIIDGAGGADDGQLADNQILAADAPAVMTISEAALEGIAGNANIILQANNNLTIQDLSDNALDFAQTAGFSVTLRADADNNGAGAFTMLDQNDILRTQGGDINVRGAGVTAGHFDPNGGDVLVESYRPGGINLRSITNAFDIDVYGSAGNPITIVGDVVNTGYTTIDTWGGNSPVSITGNVTNTGTGIFIEDFGGNGGVTIIGNISSPGDIFLDDENGPGPGMTIVGDITSGGEVWFEIGGGNNLNVTGEITAGNVVIDGWAIGPASAINGNITTTTGDIDVWLDDTTIDFNGDLLAAGDIDFQTWDPGVVVNVNGDMTSGGLVTLWLDDDGSTFSLAGSLASTDLLLRNTGDGVSYNMTGDVAVTNDINFNVGTNTNLAAGGAFSAANDITVAGTSVNFISGTLQANNNVTLGPAGGVTTGANVGFVADADGNNTGNFVSNTTLTTGNNNLALSGAQIDINNAINAGTGTVTLTASTAKAIGVGGAVADNDGAALLDFSSVELGLISANDVVIGDDSVAGGLTVLQDADFSAGGVNYGITLKNGGDILLNGEVTADVLAINAGGSILDGNGAANNITATGNALLNAQGNVGTLADAIEVNVTGGLSVTATDFNGSGASGTISFNGLLPSRVDAVTELLAFYDALFAYSRPHMVNDYPGIALFNSQPLFSFSPANVPAPDTGFLVKNNDPAAPRNQQSNLYLPMPEASGRQEPAIETQVLGEIVTSPVNTVGIRQAEAVQQKGASLRLVSPGN